MKSFSFFCICLSLFIISCSSTISNPQISQLESRKQLLKYNTKLNQYKLELAKERVRADRAKEKLVAASNKAREASDYSHNIAQQLNQNPQNVKLANKAEKASKKSADRAEDVNEINHDLQDYLNNIKDLQKDIDDTNEDIQKLQSRIQFVPAPNPQ